MGDPIGKCVSLSHDNRRPTNRYRPQGQASRITATITPNHTKIGFDLPSGSRLRAALPSSTALCSQFRRPIVLLGTLSVEKTPNSLTNWVRLVFLFGVTLGSIGTFNNAGKMERVRISATNRVQTIELPKNMERITPADIIGCRITLDSRTLVDHGSWGSPGGSQRLGRSGPPGANCPLEPFPIR